MSEYQYYEWLAVDRPLTDQEMDAVDGLSSHMDVVTATQAAVTYSWGDFKHNPRQVLLKYFDAFLYMANWGSRRLMFRFPASAIDEEAMRAYCVADRISLSRHGDFQVLEIDLSEEEGGDWIEPEGILRHIVPLREQIIRGDYRALYLAWLKAKQLNEGDGVDDEDDGDGDGDGSEPPVPAGLRDLTAGLQAFAQFCQIDPHLIQAAAEASDPLEMAADHALAGAIARLPRQECDAFLLRVLQNEPRVSGDLRKRLADLAGVKKSAAPRRNRSFEMLTDAAGRYAQEERHRAQEEAERKRVQKLEELAAREEAAWEQAERLIERKQAKPYDEAVALLVNLRDLAKYQRRLPAYESRLSTLAGRYAWRPALMERLRRAGLAV